MQTISLSHSRHQTLLRIARIAIAGATGALLTHGVPLAGECAAAEPDGARAVEETHHFDSAVAPPSVDAALQLRIDEMRERRSGHQEQRKKKLRRLTPEERMRRIQPQPRKPRRKRDLNAVLERVNDARRQVGAPPVRVEQ